MAVSPHLPRWQPDEKGPSRVMSEGGPETLVYKIATSKDWAAAIATGAFTGSADDVRDGYIHLSTKAQLDVTANKYFTGARDLVLVAIPASSLGSALVFEPSRGGELFPHYYGSLPVALARWVRALPLDDAGRPCVAATLLIEADA